MKFKNKTFGVHPSVTIEGNDLDHIFSSVYFDFYKSDENYIRLTEVNGVVYVEHDDEFYRGSGATTSIAIGYIEK